jgi:hypothetical protein
MAHPDLLSINAGITFDEVQVLPLALNCAFNISSSSDIKKFLRRNEKMLANFFQPSLTFVGNAGDNERGLI